MDGEIEQLREWIRNGGGVLKSPGMSDGTANTVLHLGRKKDLTLA